MWNKKKKHEIEAVWKELNGELVERCVDGTVVQKSQSYKNDFVSNAIFTIIIRYSFNHSHPP